MLEPQLGAATCAGGGSDLLQHVASGNVALLDGPESSDAKLPTGLEQSGAATSMAGTSRRNNSSAANKKQQKRPRNPRDIKVTKWRCSVKIPALLGEKPVQPEPEDLFAKLREAEESIAEKAFKMLMQKCNEKGEFFSSDGGRVNPDSGEEDSAAQKTTAEENKSCPGGGGVGEVEMREEARATGTSSSDSDSTEDAREASSLKRGAGKQTSSAIRYDDEFSNVVKILVSS